MANSNIVSMKSLLEAGVHFVRRRPRVRPRFGVPWPDRRLREFLGDVLDDGEAFPHFDVTIDK